MILPIFLLISAGIIVTALLSPKKPQTTTASPNEELEAFYAADTQVPAQLLRQLMKAARVHISRALRLKQRMEVASQLCHEKLISSAYYERLVREDEDLALERFLIEDEAEGLQPGFKDHVMNEARRLPEPAAPPKKRFFDEALYAKRAEVLMTALRERCAQS